MTHRSDPRKKLLLAKYRQERAEAQLQLSGSSEALDLANRAFTEIRARATRLRDDLRTPGPTGEVLAGRLQDQALDRARNRVQLLEAEKREVVLKQEAEAAKHRLEAAQDAAANAQRAVDHLKRTS
jgi:hypothetical protein